MCAQLYGFLVLGRNGGGMGVGVGVGSGKTLPEKPHRHGSCLSR